MSTSALRSMLVSAVALLLVGSAVGGVTATVSPGENAPSTLADRPGVSTGSGDTLAGADSTDRGATADGTTADDSGQASEENPTRSRTANYDSPELTGPDSQRRTGSDSTRTASDSIVLNQAHHLTPDEPGQVRVTMTATIPDRVASLNLSLSRRVTVTGTDGFSQEGSIYAWNGETEQPTITYTLPANVTSATGEFQFVDVGQWALVKRAGIGAVWTRYGDSVSLEGRSTVAGSGVTGGTMVYLGDYEQYNHTAHDQTFNLVVPEAASLTDSRTDILDSLSSASDALRVGDRDEQVYVFAAPTTGVDWDVAGLQTGDTDMWVRDSQSVDSSRNTWVHEYVHTRQDYSPTDTAEWTIEGMADYFAAVLTLNQDRVGFDSFQLFLEQGTYSPQTDAVLADQDTWDTQSQPQYRKGRLVAGELDRQIRLATDSEATLQTVLHEMNSRDTVDAATFLSIVESASNSDVRRTANTYTTTSETPGVWSQSEHEDAFGTLPARISYGIARGGDTPYGVAGPYRNETIASPVTVVENETLQLIGYTQNTGGVEGQYNLTFTVDGELLSAETGRLPANETVRQLYNYTFGEPGTHTVSVGSDSLAVEVREPATPSVTAIEANRSELTGSGTVTVTATVSNDAEIPGRRTVSFTRNGAVVTERTVHLEAGETTTVTATVGLTESGDYTFGAGDDQTITVTVEPEPTPTSTPTPAASPTPATTSTASGTQTVTQDGTSTPTSTGGASTKQSGDTPTATGDDGSTAANEQTTRQGEDGAGETTGGSGPGVGAGVTLLIIVVAGAVLARGRR